MQTAAPPQFTSTQRIQLAVDRVMGIGTTREDIVEEWAGRRPELEEKRQAIERLRNEGKNEPTADIEDPNRPRACEPQPAADPTIGPTTCR